MKNNRKKIFGMGAVFLMILITFLPTLNGTSVNKNTKEDPILENIIEKEIFDGGFSSTNYEDVSTQTHPKDSTTPITVYGTQLYGKEWDQDRKMWRYRYRFDWHQAKRGEAFGDSGWDKYPYVVLEVDLSIQATGIVPASGNDFAHGGWNVERHNTGNFEEIGQVICGAVLACFPSWFGLSFGTGLSLAKALKDTSPTPSYTWQGTQVKEGNGFFQYDCYVNPNTDWEVKFYLDFWGSSVDREYQNYILGWRWYGTSPGEPTANIKISPTSYNYGDVKIGDHKDKSFKVENTGSSTANINARFMTGSGVDFSIIDGAGTHTISAGGQHTVTVRFEPSAKRSNYACLEIIGSNCNNVDADLYGTGVKSKSVVYQRIFNNFPLFIYLTNKLFYRNNPNIN